jgi:hypothetical protein
VTHERPVNPQKRHGPIQSGTIDGRPNDVGSVVSCSAANALTSASSISAWSASSAFSDALKGLHVYGAKLVRPSGIATLTASIT